MRIPHRLPASLGPLVIAAGVTLPATPALGQDDPPASGLESAQIDPFDPGASEIAAERWRGLRRLERIQYFSNIATLEGSPTLLPLRPWDTSLDLSTPRPRPLGHAPVDALLGDPLEPVLRPWRAMGEVALDQLGLNTSAYYTLLYQNVSDPTSGNPRNLGTGRLDVNLVWNLWDEDRSTTSLLQDSAEGHGLLGILVRQGNQIGSPQGVSTQTSAGSSQTLDCLYSGPNGGPATLNLLYFQQGWASDRLVVSVGKIHPNQYIGLNFWANDESRQFLAGPFDGIQALGSSQGGYQLGVAVQAVPTDSIFVNAVVTDALGRPDNMFSTLDEGCIWTAAEIGCVLPIDEKRWGGPTAVSLIWAGQNLDALATTPQKAWSNAVAFQWQGHLTEQLGYWAQGGWSEARMSTTNAGVSVGLGIDRPFGREGDLFGIAYNWSRPTDRETSSDQVRFVGLGYNDLFQSTPSTPSPRPQSLVEMFYRIQLTDSMQLTPDVQVVFDPASRNDTDTVVVLGLRLTTDF